ncbi:MAG TPA: malectin domain-containing carbohydrate-binding protein [Methylomirabilota bacterium]|nr:malectin domain-containing carbohydrate-binding protein [Methylomirabilota bacterium]
MINLRKQATARVWFRPGLGAAPALSINCGGAAAAPFLADQLFLGGATQTVGNAIDTTGVTNPAPQAVYQSRRYGPSGASFTYAIGGLAPDVPYRLRLHFAEINAGTIVADRVTQVLVDDGRGVQQDLVDIVLETGGTFRALVREFVVVPPAGQLLLTFNIDEGDPQINGIELQPAAPAFFDLGDVQKHKFAPDIKRAAWSSALKGRRLGVQQVPYEMHWRWQFTLNEQLLKVAELRGLAAGFGPAASLGGNIPTNTIANVVKGGSYDLGKRNITALTVDGNPTPTYVEGADYTLERGAGLLTVLETGAIAAGSTIRCTGGTYDAAPVVSLGLLKRILARGTFRIAEYDQFAEVPRELAEFVGQGILTNLGEDDVDKPSEFELEVTAESAVTVQKRKDS